tara:strand:+ start:22 stop:1662 length:1641 start_codon:yes stop_codon:yes gene_type:complete
MPRPKLKEGEKGNYRVSMEEYMRREARKKVKAKNKNLQKQKTKVANLSQGVKKANEALNVLENGGTLSEDSLEQAPKAIKDAIKQGSQIIFKSNAGPQEEFLAAPEKEVLYGGAAGGGKSYAMLVDLLRFASNGNHRALLLRRTLGELTELIDQSRKIYPRAFPGSKFKESKSTWAFPSGATATFSYVDKDSDVTRYQGQSFTWIGIDELGHYPTPYVWNYLRSRLRTTDPDIETYMRASANPGGMGGWWIKKMFIDPTIPNQPFWATDVDTGAVLKYGPSHARAGQPLFQRKFIPARLTDNPYLMHSGEYEAMLLSLPEVERRRLLEGDWDVAEGAAFSEFDRSVHVVEPFEVPTNWPRIRAADYGFSSPSCVLWAAIDWDSNIWVYRELYKKGLTGEDLGDLIVQLEALDPPMQISVLDKSCWSKTGIGPSIAETMMTKGVRWVPSDSNRMAGKIEVHRRLKMDDITGQPRLRIASTCTNLIRTLPTLPLSKTNSEDVDTKAEDHAYDALRYMVMMRRLNYNLESFSRRIKDKPMEMADAVFGY